VLGRVPTVGDTAQEDNLKLTVLSMDGHRVKRLRAVRIEAPKPDHINGNGNGNGRRNGRGSNGGE
jgi:hypothetical protein